MQPTVHRLSSYRPFHFAGIPGTVYQLLSCFGFLPGFWGFKRLPRQRSNFSTKDMSPKGRPVRPCLRNSSKSSDVIALPNFPEVDTTSISAMDFPDCQREIFLSWGHCNHMNMVWHPFCHHSCDSCHGTIIKSWCNLCQAIYILSPECYTLGRAFAYVVISFIIVSNILSVPEISFFLQENMNKILGHLLIIAGLFVLEILSFSFGGFRFSENFQKRLGASSIVGASISWIYFCVFFLSDICCVFFRECYSSFIEIWIEVGSANYLRSWYSTSCFIVAESAFFSL